MLFSSIENTKSLIAFLENSNQYKVLLDKNPFHSIGYLDSKKGIMYLYSSVKKVSKLEIDKLKTHK